MRLLLVEDNKELATLVCKGLDAAGFASDVVATAADARVVLATTRYAAVVLDLGLPDEDGLAVLGGLRARADATPVLVLTARGGVRDRVLGLRGGADDYLVKPFVFEELIARLQAKLRRPQLIEENILRWRDISINPATREAWRGKDPLEFTQREFDLLEVFMREPRRVFSKDHLLEIVWGHDFEGGPNIVETYISYLRAKIDRAGEPGSFIRTVRGVGYGLSQ